MTRDIDTPAGDTTAEPTGDTPTAGEHSDDTQGADTGVAATGATPPATQAQPECWCVYGTCGGGIENFGLEVVTPGCPTHDPQNTPAPADPADAEPCDVCADGPQDCTSCDGSGEDGGGFDCTACYGSGTRIPDHCCACGGSPYCNCCSKCGARCVGDCRCSITVQMHDGSTRTV